MKTLQPTQHDVEMMRKAIELAEAAAEAGEIPVAAVLYDDSGIVEPRTHIVACSTETRGVERASEIVSRTRSSQTSG